jgi:branched-chain amino acid transport system permease protein
MVSLSKRETMKFRRLWQFMADILQLLFSGLMIGSVYGLVATGFNIVYNATEAINFAQGEFVMLGGMIAAVMFASWGLSLPLVCVFAVAFCIIFGVFAERIFFGLCKEPTPLNLIIVTLGLATAMKGAVMMIWGKFAKSLPAFSGEQAIFISGAALMPQAIWIVAISLVVMLCMHIFLNKTEIGTAMRAAAADKMAASLVGIRVARISMISFGIASGIGSIAGVILTPVTMTSYDHGTMMGLKAFCAAIIGGMGNVYGGLLGGIILGLVEAFAAGWGASGYRDVVAFFCLILILFLKPSGIIGETGRGRVAKI